MHQGMNDNIEIQYSIAPAWSVNKPFDEIFAILIDKFYRNYMISNPISECFTVLIIFYNTYVLLFENSNQRNVHM